MVYIPMFLLLRSQKSSLIVIHNGSKNYFL